MSEHSPGPWIILEKRMIVARKRAAWSESSEEFGAYICDVTDTIEGLEGDDPIADANARLIAAAPALLAACECHEAWANIRAEHSKSDSATCHAVLDKHGWDSKEAVTFFLTRLRRAAIAAARGKEATQ